MAQVRESKIMKFIQVDAAKVMFGGFLFRVIGFDAARHVVPLISVWSASNEGTLSWGKTGSKTVQLYGASVNNAEMTGTSDRDKGLVSGFFTKLDLVNETRCHTHLKVDVGSHCGAAAVKPFVQMAYATSIDRFNRLKATAPLKLLQYLESMDESKWAKAHHKVCTGGRMSSSVRSTAYLLFLKSTNIQAHLIGNRGLEWCRCCIAWRFP